MTTALKLGSNGNLQRLTAGESLQADLFERLSGSGNLLVGSLLGVSDELRLASASALTRTMGNLTIDGGLLNGKNIPAVPGTTKEPTGFVDRTSSTLSNNPGTRTFTITPVGSFDVWVQGTRYTKSAPENVVWPNVVGAHVFYYDTAGVLQTTNNSTTIANIILGDGALVAAVYWSTTDSAVVLFMDERHGVQMDAGTHSYLHNTRGAQLVSGGTLSGFSIDGNGTVNAHAQFAVDAASYSDEDILFTISDGVPQDLSPAANIPIMYLSGVSSEWRRKTADAYPCLQSGTAGYTGANGRLAYNQFTGGAWQLTEVGQLDFVLVHIYLSNDVSTPVIGILGQQLYTSLRAARLGVRDEQQALREVQSLLSPELVPIGTVIFRSSSAYTNAPRAAIQSTEFGANYVDLRPSAPRLEELDSFMYKRSVRVATTANITLSATPTVDGVALAIGDDVLVKNQSTASQNGIYTVQQNAWVRREDYDQAFETIPGIIIYVTSGTASGDTLWSLTTDPPITIGSTSLSFSPVNVATGNPSNIGAAAAQGTQNRLSRQDHVHAHGNLLGGTLHAVASTSTDGFLGAADKAKLDTLNTNSLSGGYAYFAIWAEENAVMSSNSYAWSFGAGGGSGSSGGIVIPVSCELYALCLNTNGTAGTATVAAELDGVEVGTVSVTASSSAFSVLGSPVAVTAGKRINFETKTVTSGTSTSGNRVTAFFRTPVALTVPGAVRGDILYYGASGWTRLPAGVSGQLLRTQGPAADPTWATVSGTGDVVGPASATDNAVARYDATTGKLLQDSGVTIDDSNNANFGNGNVGNVKSAWFNQWASLTPVASAVTVDYSSYQQATVTLNAASVAITLTPPSGPTAVRLLVVQDGTGGRAITWTVGSKPYVPSGTLTIATASNARTLIGLVYDGTDWYAVASQPMQQVA